MLMMSMSRFMLYGLVNRCYVVTVIAPIFYEHSPLRGEFVSTNFQSDTGGLVVVDTD